MSTAPNYYYIFIEKAATFNPQEHRALTEKFNKIKKSELAISPGYEIPNRGM